MRLFLLVLVVLPSFYILVVTYKGLYKISVHPMEYNYSREEHSVSEIQQVVFAKIHKAASSTVQNILLRFALTRNLTVLLPLRGAMINQKSFQIVRRRMVPHPDGKEKFDILCNHVVYNEAEIAKYFPDSAVRVVILREPMKQALSALVYYSTRYRTPFLKKALEKYPNDPINGYLRHPEDFYEPDKYWGPMTSFINNRMSLDLGFDPYQFELSKHNTTKIETFLKTVEKEFDLVLISDYFEESMVLLRRKLRWSMKDIIYLKVNTAKQQRIPPPLKRKPKISSKVAQIFRQWDKIDFKLYEHFLPKFQRAIRAEPHFEQEVRAFKTIRKEVEKFCLHDMIHENLIISKSVWGDSFIITKFDCFVMQSEEIPLVEAARQIQLFRYRYNSKTIYFPKRHKMFTGK